MGSLIGMAVYSTEENEKDDCFSKTLQSLEETVDLEKHQLILSINAYTDFTKFIISQHGDSISKVIWNDTNIGTAEAINLCWKERQPGQHCIKMDDDVVIHSSGWIELMEEVIRRDASIGQIGLKRKDCWEFPYHEDPNFRSEMMMLAHASGDRWIIVEKVKHVIGTCVMHSSALLDQVGYLRQPSQYGYDDVLMSHRADIAKFKSCFLSQVEIDHIDDGLTLYQDWKHKHSGEQTQAVIDLVHRMYKGEESIYYNPFE